MTSPDDPRSAGDRIEALLRDLDTVTDGRTYEKVEELLRSVVELYGAALSRVLEFASEEHADGLTARLAGDDLVSSLLLVHGLHPDSLGFRVERALEKVRPLLAQHGGGVELLDVDVDSSAVLLRLVGSCSGCPSSSVTLREAVERAVLEAAPEVTVIDVEQDGDAVEAVAVALGPKPEYRPIPEYRDCPSEAIA